MRVENADDYRPGAPRAAVDAAGRALADLQLPDDEGSAHRLGDAWLIRPVVLAFLRHYGCIFCRRRVAELTRYVNDVRAAGAGIALVGLGTPDMARDARRETGWRGPIYVDEEGLSYRAAGLARATIAGVLRPRVVLAALRARKEGFRQGRTRGDPWQLGGTMVVAPGDRVLYAWRNRFADDDAPMEEVLAVLRRVAKSGG
jgi:peroxiredoxin